MNTCKTCKHRGTRGHDHFGVTQLGRVFFECTKIEFYKRSDMDSLALLTDSDDYNADLLVSDNFGCVLWEANAQPPAP